MPIQSKQVSILCRHKHSRKGSEVLVQVVWHVPNGICSVGRMCLWWFTWNNHS